MKVEDKAKDYCKDVLTKINCIYQKEKYTDFIDEMESMVYSAFIDGFQSDTRITQPTTTETMQCDEGCEYECTKGGTQPKSCETLQEGDWTKCEKFSEWVALFEIESSISSFDTFWRDEFTLFNGDVKTADGKNMDGILLWGKGENFLPYQEFKQRAENTFKTK